MASGTTAIFCGSTPLRINVSRLNAEGTQIQSIRFNRSAAPAGSRSVSNIVRAMLTRALGTGCCSPSRVWKTHSSAGVSARNSALLDHSPDRGCEPGVFVAPVLGRQRDRLARLDKAEHKLAGLIGVTARIEQRCSPQEREALGGFLDGRRPRRRPGARSRLALPMPPAP